MAIKLKSPILLKLGTNVRFGEGVIKAEILHQKLLFPSSSTPCKKGDLTLLYAYLMSCLWLSNSTTRKAMLNKMKLKFVSKLRYSFKLGNLCFLFGSILSKVYISWCIFLITLH